MIEKILLSLIRKEKMVGLALSFILGAATTGLGVNAEVVKAEFCESVSTSSE